MTKKDKFNYIFNYIDSLFPNAKCELFYSKDYELVIAVMLSAQTTDKAVNKVTSILFNKYKTLEELDNASFEDIENIIKPLGLAKNKTKNIKEITHILLTKYNGLVPSDKEELTLLPGVGNKTAGVIRAEYFNIPELPVDTHILRISKRLNICKNSDSPIETETKLKKMISRENWIKTHHQLIHFGRYFCKAISPKCHECKIKEYCNHLK